MAAWGMLAATFKSAPVGFYETGNRKATFTIEHCCTKGVSSLASMRRKRSQEKHQHICNNALKMLASGFGHDCQTTFPITLFSYMSVPLRLVCAQWKKLLCVCVFNRFPGASSTCVVQLTSVQTC